MRQMASLSALSTQVDSFLIDMWGVLWDGTKFYDGALDFLADLKRQGKHIAILSNTTQLGQAATESYCARGLTPNVHTDMFITSGDLCFEKVQNGLMNRLAGKDDYAYTVVGTANPSLFSGLTQRETADINAADVLYISGCGTALSIDPFVPQLKQALDKNIPAFCANPDYSCMIKGVEHPANGALAKWYADHGGTVLWMGKPYPEIYHYALQRTGFNANRTLMIGDTLRTDIAGAKAAGIQSALITKTGITANALAGGADLNALTTAAGVRPDYIVDTFAPKKVTLQRLNEREL